MGTVLNGNLDVFQTIVTALTKHDDLQLVHSAGDQVDPQRIVSPPKNAIIVPRAPQLDLLKLASVCVTHAGLNTVVAEWRLKQSLRRVLPREAAGGILCKPSRVILRPASIRPVIVGIAFKSSLGF